MDPKCYGMDGHTSRVSLIGDKLLTSSKETRNYSCVHQNDLPVSEPSRVSDANEAVGTCRS